MYGETKKFSMTKKGQNIFIIHSHFVADISLILVDFVMKNLKFDNFVDINIHI